MLGTKRTTQMDRIKAAVREAVAYIDEVAHDERLRGDLRSAITHGEDARDRIRKDVAGDGVATRLANDRKLRKKVRAMVEDLDSAGDRLRRKERHRLRNGLLCSGVSERLLQPSRACAGGSRVTRPRGPTTPSRWGRPSERGSHRGT